MPNDCFPKRVKMINKNLSPTKRALLEKWMRGESNSYSATIPRRPVDSPSLTSYQQRRQLFLELFNRDTAVNNLSVFLELTGRLNISTLEQSANKIIARHDTLRTRFCFDQGLPVPEVLPELRATISIVHLEEFNGIEKRSRAQTHAERDVRIPFDLTNGPLIRIKLFALSEEKCLLLVVVHHTIADGWSLGVFLRELMAFYHEIVDNKLNPLSALSIQYADYVHWQAGEKLEKALQSSMSYWKRRLGGELPLLELPADHPRGTRPSLSGGTHRFTISGNVTEDLEKISRESDATLFMILLTAYFILLHRYSGQDEIIVGSPIANRNHSDLENMIGVFINTLALRVDLSTKPTFREVLVQVRDVCREAYAHADLPFEKIVEELKPQRDLNRTPIFQTVFNMQSAPLPKLDIPGIEIGFVDLDRGASEFDLTLLIAKQDGACFATVEYSDELFAAETVARMFQSYQILLEDIIAHPDCSISRLQMISKEEHEHFVHELNQTEVKFPKEKCVYELFEGQVEKSPAAVALISDHDSLTYSELNRRANRLARHLKELGVEQGTRVGILMERSTDVVEALLGVLKAGGIYIPIHAAFPLQRIQFILNDANVKVLLADKEHRFSIDQSIAIVNLNDEDVLAHDDSNLKSEINSSHPAYIIYTSGSTGNPKGVIVRHSSLVNFLWSMLQRPGIKQDDVLLAVTPISFDIAALELFLPLIAGATVVIASKEMTVNPAMIGEAITRYKVSMMQATPATWQLLLETGWTGSPALNALCGGEALTRKLADQLLNRVNILWNMYGPTETTVWSSVSQINKGNDPITIGKPIGNTTLYILDHDLQIAPVGVVGELHIGGEGVADGYLNRDVLTSKQFIPDPFSSKPGARLYKTGDCARYLTDDSIEILGRMDDQVKINGHRIELQEISAILSEHPSVHDAIVIAMETPGEKNMVAYLVQKPGSLINIAELREFLGKKLPAYMIPAFFINLDSLPLTANGKIDRKALPVPGNQPCLSSYIAPRNECEKLLAEIWRNVLRIERVGIHDNFFDLGGASMQSLQVVAKANMYGIPLSVENIFEYQTIAELAAQIKDD